MSRTLIPTGAGDTLPACSYAITQVDVLKLLQQPSPPPPSPPPPSPPAPSPSPSPPQPSPSQPSPSPRPSRCAFQRCWLRGASIRVY